MGPCTNCGSVPELVRVTLMNGKDCVGWACPNCDHYVRKKEASPRT